MAKFNLAAAMGYDVSKLDTKKEIRYIPLYDIKTNDLNFYHVEQRPEDLMESIQVNGLLEPLLVTRADDSYRLISGHRRYQALLCLNTDDISGFADAPCIVLPSMSEAAEELMLIHANSTSREINYKEKCDQADKIKRLLVKLKDEGKELPGKMRDIVAEALEVSRTEAARMDYINAHLIPELKEIMGQGRMKPTVAFEAAHLNDEHQRELAENVGTGMIVKWNVDKLKVFEDNPYICRDCPSPYGYTACDLASKGLPAPCVYRDAIIAVRNGPFGDRCCGCCHDCPDDVAAGCSIPCQQSRPKAPEPEPEPEDLPEPPPAVELVDDGELNDSLSDKIRAFRATIFGAIAPRFEQVLGGPNYSALVTCTDNLYVANGCETPSNTPVWFFDNEAIFDFEDLRVSDAMAVALEYNISLDWLLLGRGEKRWRDGR